MHPFTKDGEPLKGDANQLVHLVAQEGFVLPAPYLDFIKAVNGGRIFFRQTVSFSASDGKTHGLCCLNPSAPGNVWEGIEGQWQRGFEWYPKYLFPIGASDRYDLVYLVLGEEHFGNVILLKTQATKIKPTTGKSDLFYTRGVAFVSKSFDEFVNGLKITETSPPQL
jgi:hypothetical protein